MTSADIKLHRPVNAAVLEGKNISMSCRLDSQKSSNFVSWYYTSAQNKGAPQSLLPINIGSVPYPKFSEFSFGGDSPGEILHLNNTRLSHAGIYRCIKNGQAVTSLLIVLASEPKCSVSLNESHLHLFCIVVFSGDWIPSMRWLELTANDTNSRCIVESNCASTSDNTQFLGISLEFGSIRHESLYAFQLKFSNRACSKTNVTAKNIPSYEFTRRLSIADIFYGPKNVTVHPLKSSYSSGDNLTCSSHAFPDSDFKWKELTTETVIPGPIICLETFLQRKKPYVFRCLAVNKLTNTSASSSDLEVHLKNESNYAEVSNITQLHVLTSLLLAILILFIIVSSIFFFRKSTMTRNRSRILPAVAEVDMALADANRQHLNETRATNSSNNREPKQGVLPAASNLNIKSCGHDEVGRSKSGSEHVGADGTVYLKLAGLMLMNQTENVRLTTNRNPEFNKSEYASIDHSLTPPPVPPR